MSFELSALTTMLIWIGIIGVRQLYWRDYMRRRLHQNDDLNDLLRRATKKARDA